MGKFAQWFYNFMYRFTTPDWDTGVTPPEVIATAATFKQPSRALDLGCGTGTNSIYLAQNGWQVTGIDFSPKALELARRKAQRANVQVDFHLGDVTSLDFISEPFDLILDLGCLHSLDRDSRKRYANQLRRLTHPGSKYLLYGFKQPTLLGSYHLTPEETFPLFEPAFAFSSMWPAPQRDNADMVWYDLTRR